MACEHVLSTRPRSRVCLPLRQKRMQDLKCIAVSHQQQHARALGGDHTLQQSVEACGDVKHALAIASRDGPRARCVVLPHTFVQAAA